MSIRSALFGPASKYNRDIPYTYVARIQAIEGDEDLINEYFADTICGLIDYLKSHEIQPKDVRLLGLYLKQEIALDITYCINEQGDWLSPPRLCHELEEHYLQTMEHVYKGHVEHGACSYDDRNRQGSGPY
jgi:hypothetical protein